jgi:hypothetical protein
MKVKSGTTILGLGVLAAGMVFGVGSLTAQNDSGGKQDMKNAGHETKDAAKDTGHGIKQGTKKGWHKTKHGTKKAWHATEHGTKHAAHKVEGKPDSQ